MNESYHFFKKKEKEKKADLLQQKILAQCVAQFK